MSVSRPVADFDYPLPSERIAQTPAEPRDASRLLHLTGTGAVEDHAFRDLPRLLRRGDLLVVNDTRVRAARLRGRRADGGAAEVLLLERHADRTYSALVRPARRLPAGAVVHVAPGLQVAVGGQSTGHGGARIVNVVADTDAETAIAAVGEMPVPPYIRTALREPARYQTVYARGDPASAAAPTAGLHMTARVRAALARAGVGWAAVRLDVGLGTFAPMTGGDIGAHRMHTERCLLPPRTAARIDATRAAGGRVIAVGTTVVRTLEAHAEAGGRLRPGDMRTDLFIAPGHRFAVVDGLLTNFHQPRSTLLVLLAAFVGEDRWRRAYDHALASGYRFLSFGDCMLCWRLDEAA